MDSDGYLDRECPAAACEFEFKVHGDDWKDKISHDHVHCPFCGHVADSGQWFKQDQLEILREVARAIAPTLRNASISFLGDTRVKCRP
jgi:hypothetical protein